MAEEGKEENVGKVFKIPKEVKVYGKISHVWFEGDDKVTSLIIDQRMEPSTSKSQSKKKSKDPVLIVPIEQENSEIRFVKVPIQRLSKSPKATKLGESYCQKIDLDGNLPIEEKLTVYNTDVSEIVKNEGIPGMSNTFNTCLVFKPSYPLQRYLLSKNDYPLIANPFSFQQKVKEERLQTEPKEQEDNVTKMLVEMPQQSASKRRPSVREAYTNTNDDSKWMKFLISKNKKE